MLINTDCREYNQDRPCLPHKERGRVCEDCPEYDPVAERILIIKLAALGDVLRTTSLLPGLKHKYPDSHITWIVMGNGRPLLDNNPYIDALWSFGSETIARLMTQKFDLVINLDLSTDSTSLAALANGATTLGYTMGDHGETIAANPEATTWMEMGFNDDLKTANTRTYQDLMAEIIGTSTEDNPIILNLRNDEKEHLERSLKKFHLHRELPMIGLVVGSGRRWPLKRWTTEKFTQLAYELFQKYEAQLMVLAGNEEAKQKARLLERSTVPLINPGHELGLRHFAALVDRCDLVVTGDTLALHIALALRKKTVALFGPTSAAEIEMYGLGEKITAPVECVGCYLNQCDKSPNCMESITVESVLAAIGRLL